MNVILTGAKQPATFLASAKTIKSLIFDAGADTSFSIRLADSAAGTNAANLTFGAASSLININAGSAAAHTLGVAGGNIVLSSTLAISNNSPANFTINRPITGTGWLIKDGAGPLTLSGANTYSGNTHIYAGELRLGSGGALASLYINVGQYISPDITAKFWLESSGQTLSRIINVTPGAAPNTRVVGGLNTNGTVTFSGEIWLDGDVNLSAESGGTVVVSGLITYGIDNWYGINKVGLGTMELSNSGNDYDGDTTISAGTLLVNNASGSGTGSGAVTVNSGGTLGGTGIVSGVVTVNSGATNAPGNNGIGELHTGALTFKAGSALDWEFADATADAVAVAGSLTFESQVTVKVKKAGTMTSGTFTALKYTGTAPDILNLTFDLSQAGGVTEAYATLDTTNKVVMFQVVPEPGLVALAGLALLALRKS
ncbi:MAG: autotransporter-associated beta strand repeat-containing protein [bacterium]|nr:autotransporter-associated beta strand repeat-containing protein [bacterium]